MAKGKDVQKAVKKEPLKTAKEKKAENAKRKILLKEINPYNHKAHKDIFPCELCAFLVSRGFGISG